MSDDSKILKWKQTIVTNFSYISLPVISAASSIVVCSYDVKLLMMWDYTLSITLSLSLSKSIDAKWFPMVLVYASTATIYRTVPVIGTEWFR